MQAVFDPVILDSLHDVCGDPSMIRHIVEAFVTDIGGFLDRKDLRDMSDQQLREQIHAVKGGAAAVGARGLEQAMSRMLAMNRTELYGRFDGLITDANVLYLTVLPELRAYVETLDVPVASGCDRCETPYDGKRAKPSNSSLGKSVVVDILGTQLARVCMAIRDGYLLLRSLLAKGR